MRLYAGVIRFFIIVIIINVALFWIVGVLASRSKGPVPGPNSLRLATSAVQVKTLDPVQVGDTASSSICNQVYEGLTTYDQKTLSVKPSLAESWDISQDAKTYTFHIRDGVHFHDDPCFPNGEGREVTAHDVEYNFRRVCDPIAQSTGFWLVEDRVVGAKKYWDARMKMLKKNEKYWKIPPAEKQGLQVEGFQALSDDVFRVKLKKSFAPFLKVLAMSYFQVAAPEAIKEYGPANNPPGADEFFKHPVGTGPFTLRLWKPDLKVVLKANPEYWGHDDKGRQLPHIDGVHIISRRDPHTAFMEFEEGYSDISSVPDEDWKRVMKDENTMKQPYASRYNLKTSPTLTTFYYGFDMESELFGDNKKLRQALNYAIDRQAIIDEIYRGLGNPAFGPIPPGLPGYDPENRRYKYNPDKAKELLAEAGYPGGEGLRKITLYVSATGGRQDRTSVAVMAQLKRINVDVELKQQPWPLHLESIDRREANFFRLGWIADYPDAENFLALFLSRNAPPGPNATAYSNPEFDRLYQKAMREVDEAERARIYRKAAGIITEDAPWLFTTYGETVSVRQPWVKNYPLNPLGVRYFKNIILNKPAGSAGRTAQR